jgi:hypothetical protein
MRKVLSTLAALGLAAGIATSASALELKVKGDYTVDGFYIDKGAGAAATNGDSSSVVGGGKGLQLASNPGDETNSDAWLQHMFNIEAEMVVNDKISMMSRVRLIDWGTVWGAQDDTNVSNGRNMSLERLWLAYKSPIGIWEIGRRTMGVWGLPFLDTTNQGAADRIYWKSGKLFGEEFSTYAYYQKLVEGEAYLANTDNMDSDYYEAGAALKGGWGNVSLAYGLGLNNTNNKADVPDSATWSLDSATGSIISSPNPAFYGYKETRNRIRGLAQFKLGGNMGLDTEVEYRFGTRDYLNDIKHDMDISQFAGIVDFNATMDALTGHAMYFHASGDDNTNDTDLNNFYDIGYDFEPLYILTGVFGNILNSYQTSATGSFGDAAKKAGSNAVILSADFAASQDLTLHAALGYATADKEMAGWDNEYGFEYNAGAAYKLLDNLIYAVHLGYLDTGDFFKLGGKYKDTNSILLASHHLTMSF